MSVEHHCPKLPLMLVYWILVWTEILQTLRPCRWLSAGTPIPDGVEPAFFAFPEAGVSFVPRHGDVLCFQPGQYLHCTRRFMKTDLLGVAFFQKCSLYRQLRELTLDPGGSGTVLFCSGDGATSTVETRQGFLEKKEEYQRHLRESTLSVSEFMVRFEIQKP